MILAKVYFLLCALSVFGSYFIFGEGFNTGYVFSLSLISIINMIIFDQLARQVFPRRGLFCASTLFLISYTIVFFQFPFLALFYEEIRQNNFLWYREEYVNWTTMISSGSIHLFMVGYLIGFDRYTKHKKNMQVAVASREKIRVLLYAFPLVSMGCFVVFLMLVGPAYLKGAYGGSSNWSSGASYLFRLFEVFFYLTIALEIYKIKLLNRSLGLLQYIMSFNIHTLVFILFFVAFHIYTGDRGPVISAVLILVGGYDFLFKRLPRLPSILLIVVAAYGLSFMSAYRTRDVSYTMQERIEKGKEKTKEKKFYEYTGDLASSVRIMNYAVMLTPELGSYYFGWILSGRVVTSVPFAAGFFNKMVSAQVHSTPLGSTSSSIFTYYVLGPSSKIGVGTSILADLYIDFGIVGCFLGMFLFGVFISWAEVRASNSIGLFHVVFYLLVVSYAIYWPRSFIGVAFQQWFLSLLTLYLIYRWFLGRKKAMVQQNLAQLR